MKNTLYRQFKQKGFNFFIGIPGSELQDLIKAVQMDKDNIYVPVNREDTAVAMAVGAYFAGKKPLVFLQNSGLGNIINILTSLLKLYEIPINFLIGVRKKPSEHVFMYKITKQLVNLLEVETYVTYIEEDD